MLGRLPWLDEGIEVASKGNEGEGKGTEGEGIIFGRTKEGFLWRLARMIVHVCTIQ